MPKRVFSVGYNFPGGVVQQINYQSRQTLLDADSIIFQPDISPSDSGEGYQGKPVLYESTSFEAKENNSHWRSELSSAYAAGKLIIIYLNAPQTVFIDTGQRNYSGTGRNRATTRIVDQLFSYSSLPINLTTQISSGTNVVLSAKTDYLAAYWKEFGAASPFQTMIDGKFNEIVLKTKAADRVVGALIKGKAGVMILLPPVQYDRSEFTDFDDESGESFWTKEATKFGNRLLAQIINLENSLKSSTARTPSPSWTQQSRYRLTKEVQLEQLIHQKNQDIVSLQEAKTKLEAELSGIGDLRGLLYVKGQQLEDAVLEALKLFGFSADGFDDGDSEFDAVFSSPEGRFLGEAEGKNNHAINIDKLSQLERNIQEDFAREEVTIHANGVLFGNPYRLLLPEKRPDFFTEKCLAGAKRSGISLVHTPDLFGPAKYLKEHDDSKFATKCREAIILGKGGIVVFPPPPQTSEDTTISNNDLVAPPPLPLTPPPPSPSGS